MGLKSDSPTCHTFCVRKSCATLACRLTRCYVARERPQSTQSGRFFISLGEHSCQYSVLA